ncbi:hypothetical protein ACLI1A_16525 [Flavobacterium sp. RHBU_3]|uniref:hypothetical protein n=1 Tax=Flavobacterium sp. RHBU_3 TaxID=3391184 RepID=UPI00398472C7
MSFNIEMLKGELEKACAETKRSFYKKFSRSLYVSNRGAKLESFISELQNQFQCTSQKFIKDNSLEKNTSAKRIVAALAREYAKKAVEDFSRIQ